jgi:thiol-disulfide isomerase/thioredoxin
MKGLLIALLLAGVLPCQELSIPDAERELERDPNDLPLLETTARTLLETDSPARADRALRYARRYEDLIEGMLRDTPQRRKELSASLGQALRYEARATGNLGRLAQAVELARRAFQTYPEPASAHELARWLERAGKPDDAGHYLAEAVRLGQSDPNADLSDPMKFTLSGMDGKKLNLADLTGKTVVLDFWATWCASCKEQHKLFDEIRRQFQGNGDVVFLSISTDDDKNAVEPFLAQQDWEDPVYFEDGLSRLLKIAAIPTSIVIDRQGHVFERMNGYAPDKFVDLLSGQIRGALSAK